MQRLQELGVDTSKAGMCWVVDGQGITGNILCITDEASFYSDAYSYNIPTFTLQDILDLLPKVICRDGSTWPVYLYIDFENDCIMYCDMDMDMYRFEVYHEEIISYELIDAAYNMLVWVIENGYIKMEETK